MKNILISGMLVSLICCIFVGCGTHSTYSNDSEIFYSEKSHSEISYNMGNADTPGTPSDVKIEISNNTGYNTNTDHGELKMYKYCTGQYEKYNDLYIGLFRNYIGYFSEDDRYNGDIFCFDPTCKHGAQDEGCQAKINVCFIRDAGGPISGYEKAYFFLDLFDNKESPVFYIAYKRDSHYSINGIPQEEREPCWCIERFDLSEGKRMTVADKIKYTVTDIATFGDYIYFVMNEGDEVGQRLYRIYKGGKKQPECCELDVKASEINILEAVNGKLFFSVNGRSIYQSEMNLSEAHIMKDLAGNDDDGSTVIFKTAYNGYLYYLADIEEVILDYVNPDGKPCSSTSYKCNCYRTFLGQDELVSEKIIENMCAEEHDHGFTQGTLYYQPFVFEYFDETRCTAPPDIAPYGFFNISMSHGTLIAYDMQTDKSTILLKDTYVDINFHMALNDAVMFSGLPNCDEGVEFSHNYQDICVYLDGSYEIFEKGFGSVNFAKVYGNE